MAGELKVQINIGGAVEPVLGQVFDLVEAQVVRIESLALRIGEALRRATEQALPLASALRVTNDAAAESAQKWQASLGEIGKRLSTQLETLPRLTKTYDELGKAMGAVRFPAAGQSSGREDAQERVNDASRTVLQSADGAVDRFATYEGIVSKLVIQGEKDPAQREVQRARIEAQIGRMTYGTSLSKTEAASQLLGMFDAGMGLNALVPEGRLAARFSDGQQVSEGVTAGLFRTLSPGQGSDGLERLLNTLVGQAGAGLLGISQTAEAITRLLPQVGGDPQDAIRLSAILQQESGKTGNYNDIVSNSKALFLEYQRERGNSAADMGRYGQAFMPSSAKGPTPNYIENDLADRRQTLEWQGKAQQSANEGVSVAVGGALAPLYSQWTSLMTTGANVLGRVVEQLGAVVTVLGGVVVGGAALLTSFAALAKGKVLLEAVRTVAGPRGKVLAEAAATIFKPAPGAPGWRARVGQAVTKVGTLLPEVPRPSKVPLVPKLLGGALAVAGSAVMALDTYQNAETGREKAEGYGQAAGALAVGLLGAFLGPVGALAGGYIGGKLGKVAGRKVNELWGDEARPDTSGARPPLAELPGADAGKLLTVVKAPEAAALLLKAPGETVDPGQGARPLAPVIPFRGARIDSPNPAIGQPAGERPPLPLKSGDVVRSLGEAGPSAAGLPAPSAPAPVSITTSTPQHFAVSPTIAINIQGSVTDPAELVRVLQPEIQRLFNGYAAQANSDGHIWDTPAVTFVA
ncbi:hypothetical protein [Pseudomonas putida]|uniref:Phage tail tape measure protein n=1 Tax=Pseudomonas putida TaxID=303 RepID=A0A177SRS0_PSEPU|nr:hypothetical protein [Pseudomonas putida]OAI93499.1 hypothetical protein AYO28_13985 [Pseudomonas putida]